MHRQAHLAAGVVSELLSDSTPALTRLLVTTASSTAANAAAGTANKAIEQVSSGQPLDLHYNAENLGQDLFFGLHHGASETFHADATRVQAEQQYQQNNDTINAARERTAPVTAATGADHLAIPITTDPSGATTADPARADAAMSASFAARNPDAPKLDTSVIAKARNFAPPGNEPAQPVVLTALDQRINDLESQAADTAQSRGTFSDVDLGARAQSQQELAQAYPQKADIINQGDARLLAVQQISALPDRQPPTDPATGQTSGQPDPSRDRETAGALLKVANGFGLDQLTAAEQARLKPGSDAPASIRQAPGVTTIPTDAGRQALAHGAPAAAPLTPHTFRHAFATHVHRRRETLPTIQQQLGHKHIETTMIYVHEHVTEVRSPLDDLMAWVVVPLPTALSPAPPLALPFAVA